MSVSERGTDRAGRRAKRFSTPLQTYEIWLQLVRQEVTIAEAATQWEVDRRTVMRIRTVAKERATGGAGRVSPGGRKPPNGTGELEAAATGPVDTPMPSPKARWPRLAKAAHPGRVVSHCMARW